MEQLPIQYLIWIDAFRFCVAIGAAIAAIDLIGNIRTNKESGHGSPRGRAIAWLLVCIGAFIGAGLPFIRGLYSIGWVEDVKMARIVIATWFFIFLGFSARLADRAERKGIVFTFHLLLIPVAWFASSIKHGVL